MGAITSTITKKIMIVAAAAAVTGLAAACGTSTSSPGASASASATAGLAQFKAVATGPEAKKLQADLAVFVKDATSRNLNATQTDARHVAADITAWAGAMRATAVPSSFQAAKATLLRGLDKMSAGVTKVADGLHNNNMTQINQGNAEVEQAVTVINQARSQVH
ncbi:MAG TPA: hypothetical protein VMV17_23300 [Streptosporangiaceae bacterium]|nr:hypothetical protein [Streptosporangiaceae bacterium]